MLPFSSDQARLVELLQLLLFLRGVGTLRPVSLPPLVVLLSCWDEITGIGEKTKPEEILAKHLPLLADFVRANWAPDKVSILGVSSLSKALDENSQDEEYINRGPDQFGYIVRADGTHDPDLTMPIAEISGLAK